MELIVKKLTDLNENEFRQIKQAVYREFKSEFKIDNNSADKTFFLLKEKEEIMAMGALWKVNPVFFGEREYTFFGVINVIANKKGIGYGKRIVTSIRDYLLKNDLTGFGFCMPRNQGFYKKCGYSITTNSSQRFIYQRDGKNITNQDGQVIFYLDSSDRFMEKVLSETKKEVYIPTEGLW